MHCALYSPMNACGDEPARINAGQGGGSNEPSGLALTAGWPGNIFPAGRWSDWSSLAFWLPVILRENTTKTHCGAARPPLPACLPHLTSSPSKGWRRVRGSVRARTGAGLICAEVQD